MSRREQQGFSAIPHVDHFRRVPPEELSVSGQAPKDILEHPVSKQLYIAKASGSRKERNLPVLTEYDTLFSLQAKTSGQMWRRAALPFTKANCVSSVKFSLNETRSSCTASSSSKS